MSDLTNKNNEPSSKSKGITISITAETNAGGRKYMEDYVAVKLSPKEEHKKVPHLREQAYVGVFDGHGGKEAAKHARDRLWEVIQSRPKYQLSDVKSVMEALKEAFVALHEEMEPLRATWKRHNTGELSTAGTTASTVIFREDHMYVANVGDSTAVMAVKNGQHPIKAVVLTKDHKPEDPDEIGNVQNLGGYVRLSKKGTPRVVWERERKEGHGYDYIPFLGVSRSLGDFWSFNQKTKQFTVSPKPDVHVHPLDPKEQKFVVIASDGLWNVMTPDEVVQFIWDYEHAPGDDQEPRDVVRAIINKALNKWALKRYPADNIAVLIAFLSESSNMDTHFCTGSTAVLSTNQKLSATSRTESSVCDNFSPLIKPDLSPPRTPILNNGAGSLLEPNGLCDKEECLHRSPLKPDRNLSRLVNGKHSSSEDLSEEMPVLKRSRLSYSPISAHLDGDSEIPSSIGGHGNLKHICGGNLSEASTDEDSGVLSDDASPNLPQSATTSACVSTSSPLTLF